MHIEIFFGKVLVLLVPALGLISAAQEPPPSSAAQGSAQQLDVNWLYGAYVPKEVPLRPLTVQQRWKLYLRQSFTTPGIYVKTVLFTVGDQINDSPPAWGSDFAGFAKRFGSREGQFVIQNSFTALGDGLLGYEPRYDRCRCVGFWPRTRHALVRNFITYDKTETSIRPRLPLYLGAFGAGVVAGTWKPDDRDLVAEGYRSVITQVGFGCLANVVGEFAADVMGAIRKDKKHDKL